MTNHILANTQNSQGSKKPAEKAAPIGDQPSVVPVKTPAEPAPVVKS